MTLFQDIAIIDLLRQREAEFVVVWSCEQKIKELLGADLSQAETRFNLYLALKILENTK